MYTFISIKDNHLSSFRFSTEYNELKEIADRFIDLNKNNEESISAYIVGQDGYIHDAFFIGENQEERQYEEEEAIFSHLYQD